MNVVFTLPDRNTVNNDDLYLVIPDYGAIQARDYLKPGYTNEINFSNRRMYAADTYEHSIATGRITEMLITPGTGTGTYAGRIGYRRGEYGTLVNADTTFDYITAINLNASTSVPLFEFDKTKFATKLFSLNRALLKQIGQNNYVVEWSAAATSIDTDGTTVRNTGYRGRPNRDSDATRYNWTLLVNTDTRYVSQATTAGNSVSLRLSIDKFNQPTSSGFAHNTISSTLFPAYTLDVPIWLRVT